MSSHGGRERGGSVFVWTKVRGHLVSAQDRTSRPRKEEFRMLPVISRKSLLESEGCGSAGLWRAGTSRPSQVLWQLPCRWVPVLTCAVDRSDGAEDVQGRTCRKGRRRRNCARRLSWARRGGVRLRSSQGKSASHRQQRPLSFPLRTRPQAKNAAKPKKAKTDRCSKQALKKQTGRQAWKAAVLQGATIVSTTSASARAARLAPPSCMNCQQSSAVISHHNHHHHKGKNYHRTALPPSCFSLPSLFPGFTAPAARSRSWSC